MLVLQSRESDSSEAGQESRRRKSALQSLRATFPDRDQLPVRRSGRVLGLDRRVRERRTGGRGRGGSG